AARAWRPGRLGCGSHAKPRALDSIPPCPRVAASMAASRRRSCSDTQRKQRGIFPSIAAVYPSSSYSLSQKPLYRKDTTASAIREVILDHILRGMLGTHTLPAVLPDVAFTYEFLPETRVSCRCPSQIQIRSWRNFC